jgi:hypothetical protein
MTLVVGLCVLGVVGVASAAPGDVAGKPAQLHLMSTQPMVVRGTGFEAGERVSVIVAARQGTYGKTKVATPTGTFSVRFDIGLGRCGGYYWLRAFGAKGSRAILAARHFRIACIGTDRAPRGTDRTGNPTS